MISMVNETSKLLETALGLPVTYFKYTMDLFIFLQCPLSKWGGKIIIIIIK